MTKKPTDDPWPWNHNDDNNDNYNPLAHFDEMIREFDKMFEDTMFNDPFSILNPSLPNGKNGQSKDNDLPHLSQINPNVSPPDDNNDNQQFQRNNSQNNFFRRFFNGNDIYDRPRLSDINPNVSDIDHNHRPNFRPYLPNWNGEENPMDFNDQKTPSSPRSFYRSESVVISRDSNGNVKKTTTIRDQNGEIRSTTEEYNNDDMKSDLFNQPSHPFSRIFTFDIPSLPYWYHNDEHRPLPSRDDIIANREDNDNTQLFSLQTPNDPLKRIRPFFQKWNPFGWKKNNDRNNNNNYNNNNPDDNMNNNNNSNGIHWKSHYIDYRKKPSDLRNDIVIEKPNNNNDDTNN